jgi:hypothetical protein
MKIRSIGLNLNGERGLTPFLSDSGFSVRYFYLWNQIPKGTHFESLKGIEDYLDSIDDEFTAIVGFPTNLAYKHSYEKDSETKFICIQRDIDSWLTLWNQIMTKYNTEETYLFEEAFCKVYSPSSTKTKVADLTEDELRFIYNEHYRLIDEYFAGKPNFLKIQISDPQISAKLRTFFEITSDIEFNTLADESFLA